MQKPWGSFERYTHNLASRVKVITVALVQNDTAPRIPGGAVRLIEGVGHGAFDERKRDFDAAVEGFTHLWTAPLPIPTRSRARPCGRVGLDLRHG